MPTHVQDSMPVEDNPKAGVRRNNATRLAYRKRHDSRHYCDQRVTWDYSAGCGIAATALGERTRRYAGPARTRRG
ncbi:hypothetical protein [Lysobacter gummosus]|uniref:hypothetical protein n=1 Tax=Lysobacter gummosus TaxID=262324 RepID=UPI003629A8EF